MNTTPASGAVSGAKLGLVSRWVLILGIIAAITAATYWLHDRLPEGDIAGARMLAVASEGPPPDFTEARRVRLPHDWHDDIPNDVDYVWYSVEFLHDPAADPYPALFVSSLGMNARVYLNGKLLTQDGRMSEPVTRNWFKPLWHTLPESGLRSGANELQILVRGVPPVGGFLGRVYVGRENVLRPYYEGRYFLKVTYMHLLAGMSFLLAIPTLVIWSVRRHDTVYLWHALASVFSGMYTLAISLRDVTVPAVWWNWFGVNSIGWVVIASSFLILRFLGLRHPRRERAMLVAGIGGAVVLAAVAAVSPPWFYLLGPRLWDGLVLSLALYPAWIFLRHRFELPNTATFWLMVTGQSLIAVGFHDLLMVNRLIGPYDGYFVLYAGILPQLAFAAILVTRFLQSIIEAETLNRELQQRVEQKSSELESAYRDRGELEQARVLAEERSRLLMDMHDGVGGRLVSALARAEHREGAAGPTVASLREALADLRLIIYSLEPSADDLRSALALLRDRLNPACEDAGLTMEWRLTGLPDDCRLGPRNTLYVLRCVQEAVTNVLKHAQATRLDIAATCVDGEIRLGIEDNGCGMPESALETGRGLANLRKRAKALGGVVEWLSLQPGTAMHLRFRWAK